MLLLKFTNSQCLYARTATVAVTLKLVAAVYCSGNSMAADVTVH
jgi:hypothetical protein